jgi:hypothetical protein
MLVARDGLLLGIIKCFISIIRIECHGQNKVVLKDRGIAVVFIIGIVVWQEPIVLMRVIEPTGSGAGSRSEAVIDGLTLRSQNTVVPYWIRVVEALVLVMLSIGWSRVLLLAEFALLLLFIYSEQVGVYFLGLHGGRTDVARAETGFAHVETGVLLLVGDWFGQARSAFLIGVVVLRLVSLLL